MQSQHCAQRVTDWYLVVVTVFLSSRRQRSFENLAYRCTGLFGRLLPPLCGAVCGALCCRARASPLVIDSASTELAITSSTNVSEQGAFGVVCSPAPEKKSD